MTEEELENLEEKTKWSGFPRDEGTEIILKLIAELRYQKYVVSQFVARYGRG